MNLAVLLSTRNGARTLPQVLAAHAALEPETPPYRLVVVDNGSTDETPGLLAEAPHRWPRLDLVVLREPRPGKNRALNQALPLVADAGLVVFTDDDAVPDPDWLARLVQAARGASEYGIIGGAIRPRWMAPPGDWITDWRVPLDICYAVNAGLPEGPVAAGHVWGPNMAIRGAVLRQGHRFDTGVGPDGSLAYAMGSEVEMNERLERAGHRAWFAPQALVHHLVRPEQMTEEWILQRAYRCGLGAARGRAGGGRRLRLAGLPPEVAARHLAYGALARLVRHALPPCRLRFWLQWQARLMAGMSEGLRRHVTAQPPRGAAAGARG